MIYQVQLMSHLPPTPLLPPLLPPFSPPFSPRKRVPHHHHASGSGRRRQLSQHLQCVPCHCQRGVVGEAEGGVAGAADVHDHHAVALGGGVWSTREDGEEWSCFPAMVSQCGQQWPCVLFMVAEGRCIHAVPGGTARPLLTFSTSRGARKR